MPRILFKTESGDHIKDMRFIPKIQEQVALVEKIYTVISVIYGLEGMENSGVSDDIDVCIGLKPFEY